MAGNTIQEGDQVIFRRDGSSRVFQVRKKRQVYFEKSKFNVDELIGQPYGSTFEIDRGNLIKVEASRTAQLQFGDVLPGPGTDNRNLLDTESNQKMSKDDIMKMKDDGITGEKIIEELIENSETFKTKTEFSQAKYLKKKKKKHLLVFTVLRPTPRLVMEIFAKEPQKICYLRPDTLSQLLSYSNVMYGSKAAVVETCQGLVLACILQRMAGHGKLIQLIPNANNAVCRQVIDYFSFPKEQLENVYSFPLDKLSSLTDSTDEGNTPLDLSTGEHPSTENASINSDTVGASSSTESASAVEMATGSKQSDNSSVHDFTKDSSCTAASKDLSEEDGAMDIEMKEDDGGNPVIDIADGDDGNGEDQEEIDDDNEEAMKGKAKQAGDKRPFAPNREKQRQERALRQKEAGDIIKQKQLDSLILACKYNPTPILMKMLEFMSPSRPVVVFCQFLEPLVECYTQIKERHVGLQLKLSETWFREYQVLPQRTHPMMNMSGTGGYLLTFMTAAPSDSSKPSR